MDTQTNVQPYTPPQTPRPTHLRPLDLGDILDTVFRLYRSNFLTFVGIVALIQVPIVMIQITLMLIFNRGVTTDLMGLMRMLPTFSLEHNSISDLPISNLATFFGLFIIVGLLQGVIAQQLINGALANAVSQRYHERAISILGAYNFGFNRMVSLIIAGLIVAIITGIVAFVLYGAVIAGFALFIGLGATQGRSGAILSGVMSVIIIGLGMLFIVIIIGAIAVMFLFVTQSIVLEGHSALSALRRSIRLVRGSFWRVVGIAILLNILIQIVTLIPTSVLSGAISLIFEDPIKDFAIQQSLSTLVGYIAQILVLPFLLIGYTVLYYDLRVRKEGYDIELQTQERPIPPSIGFEQG